MSVKFFGQFLLERGKLLKQELLDALEYQKSINVKLGTIALDSGYLNAEKIQKIQAEQQRSDKMFGEIALQQNFLTQAQLDELLLIQKNECISLGDALLQKGYLTLAELEAELKEYRKEQETISNKAIQGLKNLKYPGMAETFLEITGRLLRRLGDMDADIISSHNNPDRIAPNMWNFYQQFFGDMQGTYIISVADETLLKVASHVVQERIWEVNDLAKDAMKEFVNIVLGNSAAKLSNEKININLKPPKVVTSLGHIEIPSDSKETIAATFSSTSHELQMAAVYAKKTK